MSWDLLRATGMQVKGYRERVLSERFHFSLAPDSYEDLTFNGVPIRRFTWSAPPANTVIRVTVRRQLRAVSGLKRFRSTASFPLSTVPSEIQPYLQVTPSLRLTSAQQSFVRHLVGRRATERSVVRRVADWVASHIHYDASLVGGPYGAGWVLAARRGTCQGYASVMAGMLRTLGIPSQVVYGYISSAPITIQSGGSRTSIAWAQPGSPGAFHDWLNVYFPGTGWVAFDPQREKTFVDSRHYALLTEPDASSPTLGEWMATPDGSQPVTGKPLATGATEAVPEDGTLPQQVQQQDALSLHVASVVHDVSAVTLFAR
jgi:transglutaminase-like putative cysteine protease